MATLEFERINKAAVADEVIRQLLDQMIAGALKAGDKLPSESEMADMFGVGRNSVREAIKVLQTLGIVERWQGDGSYVAESYKMPFDWLLFPLLSRVRTSSDLVELRRVLEIGVTELVIEKASPEDFEELEKKIEAMEKVGQQDPLDGDAAVETDVEFHIALARVTRNPALEQLSELVMRLFAPSMKKHLTSPQGIIHAREDHRIFFGALKMRDRDQARRSVFEAFEHWKRFIDLSS